MISAGPVTSAFVSLLGEALEVPVGDHGTTAMNEVGAIVPIDTSGLYAVVYRIDGGEVTGSFGDPAQDATLVFQVDWYGRARPHADGLADRGRRAILGLEPAGGHTWPLAGTGWRGNLRTMQVVGATEGEGTDESGRPVWVVRDRYEVPVVAA